MNSKNLKHYDTVVSVYPVSFDFSIDLVDRIHYIARV